MALLVGKIPSFTVELGTGLTPDPDIVRASVAGTRNVLRWAGMLDGEMEVITGIKLAQPGYSARRSETVRRPTNLYLSLPRRGGGHLPKGRCAGGLGRCLGASGWGRRPPRGAGWVRPWTGARHLPLRRRHRPPC
ncbi:MAG: succinylglutamate desuccinylase/aspartoacylase family protein, partial [Anaerolineae bacterium]|nr:succinylglutamate desuccinylase/aspartoacylase family protein [Anaerolineae bacterium]